MPTKVIETNPERVELMALRSEMATFVGVTVKDGFPCSFGDVLGQITTGGLYRRRTRSLVGSTAFSTANANGSVADPSLFRVGDVLTNASGATVGTIATIDPETGAVTLGANAGVNVSTGAPVLGSDGSQVAKCIADHGSDGAGDTQVATCIGGFLVEERINGLDATAKTELGGASVAGGIFKF